MRYFIYSFFLFVVACLPSLARADCPEVPAIARPPSTGSPFDTGNKGVTRLDTQTSDNVRITGGCIDVPNLQAGGVPLRTPATCDGFVAFDGAITTGTKAFASATGGFATTDASPSGHKHISIAGAGPTQFYNSATIVSGGAGHTLGEVVPLTGGTGTAASVIVTGVSGGAITAVRGAPGSLGSYTVVPSNPVTAGDATLTVAWSRDNLVTTVAGFTDATHVTLTDAASATVSGAFWGFGSDYASEINAGLVASKVASLPGGGARTGYCGITSTVSVDSQQRLVGFGAGGYNAPQSSLLWLGPVGGNPLAFESAASVKLIKSVQAGDFNVEGLCAAGTNIKVRGLESSIIGQIISDNAKDYGIDVNNSTDDLWDTESNFFNIKANVNRSCSRNATGYYFGPSTTLHDTNGNTWMAPFVLHVDGIGLDIRQGSNNSFYDFEGQTSGAGAGIYLHAGTASAWAGRNNIFYNPYAQGGIISEDDGGGFPAVGNMILGLDTLTAPPTITRTLNSTIYCMTKTGELSYTGCSPFKHTPNVTFVVPGNPAGTTDTTGKMMGLGSSCGIIARYSGAVKFTFNGVMKNDTGSDGVSPQIAYGTGAAPANGDAPTGTLVGNLSQATTTTYTPFTVMAIVTGLTINQGYWSDIKLKALTGGTANIANLGCAAEEIF